jgi:hypothetical protein
MIKKDERQASAVKHRVKSCQEFFKELATSSRQQAQAASNKLQKNLCAEYGTRVKNRFKQKDIIMKTNEAKEITGSLSKPSKMPGFAYGLPAAECKTGKKLQNVEGSTCYDCYALKGCYVFKVVQDAQYKRLAAIRHPLWVRAMAAQISSKKSKYFRWHD